ncbi:hypothetical protein ABN067_21630 [Providencia rettgeri]
MLDDNKSYLAVETLLFNHLKKIKLVIDECNTPLETTNRIYYEILADFELSKLACLSIDGELEATEKIKNIIYLIFYHISNKTNLFPDFKKKETISSGKSLFRNFSLKLCGIFNIIKDDYVDIYQEAILNNRLPLLALANAFPEKKIPVTPLLEQYMYQGWNSNKKIMESNHYQIINDKFLSKEVISDCIQIEYNTHSLVSDLVDKIKEYFELNVEFSSQIGESNLNLSTKTNASTDTKTNGPACKDSNEILHEDLQYAIYEERKRSENNSSVVWAIAVFCSPIFIAGVVNDSLLSIIIAVGLGVLIHRKFHID